MADVLNLSLPAGRLVQGSLYSGWDKDMKGNPLLLKRGPNAGQPYTKYSFKVAVPKGTEQHWNQTDWGKRIYAVGFAAFPNLVASPQFYWKIENGDDATPNIDRQGRKNCETEGFPGCWVINFSNLQAPRVVRWDASQNKWVDEIQVDFVKPGYFVQVNCDVVSNGDSTKPGLILNHRMVAFTGYGPEIQFGPDPQQAGFTTAMPAGASTVPVAAAPMPSAPAAPAAPSPIPVVPNTQFAQVPAPPAAPVKRMLPSANGVTYEAYKAAGWTDQQLIDAGLMLP